MRSKLATYALAGAIGLTGAAGAALVAPALSYAATGDSTELTGRVDRIKEALAGLVSDGSITQAQADEVAGTLAEAAPRGFGGHGHGPGHGGRGMHLAALEELGITAEEVRAAAQAGSTLAELADAQGVERQALIDALVASHQERLDAAVADGRLTQAEADEKAADLEAHVTESVDEPVRPGGGRGHHGPHGGAAGGSPADATDEGDDA